MSRTIHYITEPFCDIKKEDRTCGEDYGSFESKYGKCFTCKHNVIAIREKEVEDERNETAGNLQKS